MLNLCFPNTYQQQDLSTSKTELSVKAHRGGKFKIPRIISSL